MPLDSRPLPRSLSNPAYLQRLRERAVLRMRRDELDATQVTRRWSLQRLGLVLAASGIMLRNRPAFAATGRTPAPQYGVPGLPGNPPAPVPTSFTTREDLSSPKAWTNTYTNIVADGSGSGVWGSKASKSSKMTYYRLSAGQILLLNLVSDGTTTYVVQGGKAFYVAFNSDILGCSFDGTDLAVTPSLFRFPAPEGGDAAAIQRFAAEMDDRALTAAVARTYRISRTQDAPAHFGSEYAINSPLLSDVRMDGDILKISLYTPSGTYWIDLKSKKMVKFEATR